MKTWHIHIEGIVQGVGFRPFVYRYATKYKLKGWVNNTHDGVHIHILSDAKTAVRFRDILLQNLPPLAVVTKHKMEEIPLLEYHDFKIIKSDNARSISVLLTPDVALCEDCRRELNETANHRFHYPFITCTNCGPRYSIIQALPYDRPFTTMSKFKMCPTCLQEYNNPMERRHFSQTNSCPDCAIEMQWYEDGVEKPLLEDLDPIVNAWNEGKIVAIKGIGGFLLTCDASNESTIDTLRKRKFRARKPFALMYPNIEQIREDVHLCPAEEAELKSIEAPILLLRMKASVKQNKLAINAINTNLSRLGIMPAYTPLYALLLSKFKKPIIATSANLSDSSIIYEDHKAKEHLSEIADIIVLNNREIVIPQDDGVVQFTQDFQQKIILRRSRGKAPVYINPDLSIENKGIFATGAMLKSVFGISHQKNIYISQYLGNTAHYDSQTNYNKTYNHLAKILNPQFEIIVTDLHPDYFATRFGKEMSKKQHAHHLSIQHHKAHLFALLGEHNLIQIEDKILGIIWDGTGLGEDGHIWGGEFFVFHQKKMERIHHLEYFPYILGDKMVKESRISALAIAHSIAKLTPLLQTKFTTTEWNIYQKLLQSTKLQCSSMGRLFDAVASLLIGIDIQDYEAEASMQLECIASQFYYSSHPDINDSYLEAGLPKHFTKHIISAIADDILAQKELGYMASKFHLSLVKYIFLIAQKSKIRKLAFSGGVFQNALLVDMIIQFAPKDIKLYFHKELSPNDENIAFGQLIYGLNTPIEVDSSNKTRITKSNIQL